MAIMLAPLVPVQYSVPCSFFPADAKNVNHNEISQKNSITFDTFSFLLLKKAEKTDHFEAEIQLVPKFISAVLETARGRICASS